MEKVFKDLKVYYSGSVKGVPEKDPEFVWELVQYLIKNGADVLSEHVSGRNQEEKDQIFAKNTGKTIKEIKNDSQLQFTIRSQDIKWVDQATHVIALVNSPSLGVGMEIQRAIDKTKLGMNETPILCLVRQDIFPKLSFMIKGISSQESPKFKLSVYKDLEEAKKHIFNFLSETK